MKKVKLTCDSSISLARNIELTNDDPQFQLDDGITFHNNATNIFIPEQNLKVNKINFIEVIDNSSLVISNNELPLEDIVSTGSSTIQLNNNYTGNVKTTTQVGNDSITSLTGIELPLSTVTVEKDAIFSFTHNNTEMQINTLNDAINTPNLVIKDIHTILDSANFLNNMFNNVQGFQGNVTEGIAARIYKKNKEAVKLFMIQNNMNCNDVAIDQYFNQKYLITSALALEQDNWGDFANLPLDIVGNIFSESAYI